MEFKSLQPFVPSGPDFEKAKQCFMELGFKLRWEADGYAGLGKMECGFILQQFNNRPFAENFMLNVGVEMLMLSGPWSWKKTCRENMELGLAKLVTDLMEGR